MYLSLVKDQQGFFAAHVLGQEPQETHPEVLPMVFGHHVAAIGRGLQTADKTVNETEILKDAAQTRTQPKRSDMSLIVLEDEQAAAFFGEVAGAFDDTHHGIRLSVAIHVARLELIDGVGQRPFAHLFFIPRTLRPAPEFQHVERVVHLPEREEGAVCLFFCCNRKHKKQTEQQK